jgi:hypothetical protein
MLSHITGPTEDEADLVEIELAAIPQGHHNLPKRCACHWFTLCCGKMLLRLVNASGFNDRSVDALLFDWPIDRFASVCKWRRQATGKLPVPLKPEGRSTP